MNQPNYTTGFWSTFIQKDNLRLLVTNPELRKELGELGRKYAVKYHSYEMAQYMFTNIFKKLDAMRTGKKIFYGTK